MADILILSVQKRRDSALKIQEALTNSGCIIKTRLGIHDSSASFCSDAGLIILELLSEGTNPVGETVKTLIKELKKISGVKAKFVNI
ncbi:MAG: hypothetical protein LBT07_00600 [Endomicrobium sp.]|jgi:hypothetical protein|nr:hypothetical protein [Endomicrobium sp.]